MMYVSCIIGVIFGIVIALVLENRNHSYGTIDIDTKSSNDSDKYEVDLGNIDLLPKKRYVSLRIRINGKLAKK